MNVVGMLQSQKHVHFILEDLTHSEKVLFRSIGFREMREEFVIQVIAWCCLNCWKKKYMLLATFWNTKM